MSIKRLLTAIVGLPLVIIVFIFANKYIIDVAFCIIAIIAMYEYIKCAANKDIKIIKWISYISMLGIALIHVLPTEAFYYIGIIGIPLLLLILFLHVIISDMKITFKDITFTLMGILYLLMFIVFLPMIFALNDNIQGKILIWYVMIATWGTDIFAYLIGRKFGKTKFSKVSPNKSIEGCVAGTLGAIIGCLIYTLCINMIAGYEISYLVIGIIAFILSIIGQIGDFAASVIKRYFEVKDFSDIFPGHGGMIDRIDSVIFVAPFAYILFLLFL